MSYFSTVSAGAKHMNFLPSEDDKDEEEDDEAVEEDDEKVEGE